MCGQPFEFLVNRASTFVFILTLLACAALFCFASHLWVTWWWVALSTYSKWWGLLAVELVEASHLALFSSPPSVCLCSDRATNVRATMPPVYQGPYLLVGMCVGADISLCCRTEGYPCTRARSRTRPWPRPGPGPPKFSVYLPYRFLYYGLRSSCICFLG